MGRQVLSCLFNLYKIRDFSLCLASQFPIICGRLIAIFLVFR